MIAIEPTEKKTIHLGRNVQRTREILGMKQLTLADITGMSQQNISKLEQTESIPEDTLEKLAKGLGVSVEFIKNFNDERTIYNIQSNNTYNDTYNDSYTGNAINLNHTYKPTISNPIDKIIEQFEEIKQLHTALLKEKDEKIALLERLLSKEK